MRLLKQTAAYCQGYWTVGKMIIQRNLDRDNPTLTITIMEPRYHTLDTLPREVETLPDEEQA